MKPLKWRPTDRSKYEHLYRGHIAICGSPAFPVDEPGRRERERCPDCLRMEAGVRLRDERAMREAATCAA